VKSKQPISRWRRRNHLPLTKCLISSTLPKSQTFLYDFLFFKNPLLTSWTLSNIARLKQFFYCLSRISSTTILPIHPDNPVSPLKTTPQINKLAWGPSSTQIMLHPIALQAITTLKLPYPLGISCNTPVSRIGLSWMVIRWYSAIVRKRIW